MQTGPENAKGPNTATEVGPALKLARPLAWVAKKALPRQFLNRAYYKLATNDEKGFIVLNSTRKSGTNYFRIFIANYINVLYEGRDTPTTYKETHDVLFPNMRAEYTRFFGYFSPNPFMAKTPFHDFVYGHDTDFLDISKGKIVFLYRNPLDYVVSRFYYNWKYREATEDVHQHPREILDYALDPYIEQYTYMREVAARRDNVLKVCYEALYGSPVETFGLIVGWLGFPVSYAAIQKAVEFSSIKQVRKEEEEHGAIHAPKEGLKGFFTRSGAIGQWQEYFNDQDIAEIESRLAAGNVNLSEFILTAD